jgi:hypothetical protein
MSDWSEPVKASPRAGAAPKSSDWSAPVSADEAKNLKSKPSAAGPSDARDIIADVPKDVNALVGGIAQYAKGAVAAGGKIVPEQVARQQAQFDQIRGRMPRAIADYDSGLPWGIRANLSAADPVAGDKERRLVVEKYLPGAQVQYDKSGRMMVKPQGAANSSRSMAAASGMGSLPTWWATRCPLPAASLALRWSRPSWPRPAQ